MFITPENMIGHVQLFFWGLTFTSRFTRIWSAIPLWGTQSFRVALKKSFADTPSPDNLAN
jgi:hypothetical protein